MSAGPIQGEPTCTARYYRVTVTSGPEAGRVTAIEAASSNHARGFCNRTYGIGAATVARITADEAAEVLKSLRARTDSALAPAVDLGALEGEAHYLGLTAGREYPGFLRMIDSCGRILHIGTANGPLAVDVFPGTAAEDNGEPAASDVLQGDGPRVLVAHALQIAARVPVTHADRAYRTDAERRQADRDEDRARNHR